MNWNKVGIWVATIGFVCLSALSIIQGNRTEQAIYTTGMLTLMFLCSWFNDRY